MTKVRTIINERNGGAIHTYYPLKITLNDEGIKKPNQLTSVFTMANIVKEGDLISYIQDVTDVDALRAIYNFQLSVLDEGGYDQDPTTGYVSYIKMTEQGNGYISIPAITISGDGTGATGIAILSGTSIDSILITNAGVGYTNATVSIPTGLGVNAEAEVIVTLDADETRFSQVTTQKYKGFYALLFDVNNNSQGINIDIVDTIDISGQFDILISFTPDRTQFIDGNNEPLVWSFSDINEGLEIGISGENNMESSWRGFVRIVHNSGTFDVITGANQSIMRDTDGNSDPILIRVSRGQDNIIRLFINGEEDGTFATGDSLQPTTTVPMIFGNGRGSNDKYSGLIHQVRVYCGENLSDSQATMIRQAQPIPFSMKFRGRIWQTKDNEVSTTVSAQADSYEILSGTLGAGDPSSESPMTHDLKVTSYKNIIQSAVGDVTLFNTFIVKTKDTFAFDNTGIGFESLGNIREIGSFADFSNILFGFSFTNFFITSRNILIVETDSGKQTNFTFEQKDNELNPDVAAPYNITVSKSNDTNMANDITLISKLAGKIRRFTSQNDIKRAIRKNVEQLDNASDLSDYATRLRFILSDGGAVSPVARTKFIVKITSLINSIRPNQTVNLINNRKNIDLNEVISQVTYSYPSEHTTINLGETSIDYYDNVEKMIITSDELIDVNLS